MQLKPWNRLTVRKVPTTVYAKNFSPVDNQRSEAPRKLWIKEIQSSPDENPTQTQKQLTVLLGMSLQAILVRLRTKNTIQKKEKR